MALPGTVVAEQREHVVAPFVVAAVWIEQRVHRFQCGVDRAGTIVQRDAVRVSESVRVPSLWVSTGNAVVR